jgi:hypothetical protein
MGRERWTLETAKESTQHHAMRLMQCIIANSAVAYGILDELYVELKIEEVLPVVGRCPVKSMN